MRIILFVASIISVILLNGCGFHLRGNEYLPVSSVETLTPYDSFNKILINSLNKKEQSNLILHIISVERTETPLAVSPDLKTRQNKIELVVEFELKDKEGNVLLQPETIREQRTITIKNAMALGYHNQAPFLYEQMEIEAVYHLMNRLSSNEVKKKIKTIF